jgi:hypothetical protein
VCSSDLAIWNGSQLQLTSSAGASVTVAQTAPSSPSQGDLWWDTDDANLYLYYEYISSSLSQSAWVPATSLAIQALSANSAISASYALTASYAQTASYTQTAQTASYCIMQNYATNEYLNDTAAAAGGIPLGGLYRSGNMVLVRIS